MTEQIVLRMAVNILGCVSIAVVGVYLLITAFRFVNRGLKKFIESKKAPVDAEKYPSYQVCPWYFKLTTVSQVKLFPPVIKEPKKIRDVRGFVKIGKDYYQLKHKKIEAFLDDNNDKVVAYFEGVKVLKNCEFEALYFVLDRVLLRREPMNMKVRKGDVLDTHYSMKIGPVN